MPEKYITLAEVIRRIDNGETFSCRVVQADTTRGTGGKLVDYKKCQKEGMAIVRQHNHVVVSEGEKKTKNPNHYENNTRNIRLLGTRDTRKIHLIILVRFNGCKIT